MDIPRRSFLKTAPALTLALSGCTSPSIPDSVPGSVPVPESSTSTAPTPDSESDRPPKPYPMLVHNRVDENTIIITLDVLHTADYIEVEASTTGETVTLSEKHDKARFDDLGGGYVTITPVIEDAGVVYRYESWTYPDQNPGTPKPTATPTPTPTPTPSVSFAQGERDGESVVTVTCLGMGDAQLLYVARVSRSGDDDYIPKFLREHTDEVTFTGLPTGEELRAVAVHDDGSKLLDTYVVK